MSGLGITTADVIAFIKPKLLKRLTNYINNIEKVQKTGIIATELLAQKEYMYHSKKRDNEEELINTVLNSHGVKVLSQRSLDAIFMKCLEEDITGVDNIDIVEAFIALNGNKTVINLLKYILFNSVEVMELFNKYLDNLFELVSASIAEINKQKPIEQKTEEWFRVRETMFSASTIGYISSKDCGFPISLEKAKLREKGYMDPKKTFNGWTMPATRHGQQFEDIAGEMYDLTNGLVSREYGILTDTVHTHIGASPDGIITRLTSDSFNSRVKYGRMREIKNPYSRKINNEIPKHYYYQMQQQLYVARLPFCDFIQATIKYPNKTTFGVFKADTMKKEMIADCKNWEELAELISPYILENLNFEALYYNYATLINKEPFNNLDNVIHSLLCENWDSLNYYPLANINKRGQLKGIAWSFVRHNSPTDIDFKIENLPLGVSYARFYDDDGSAIEEYLNELKAKHLADGGFILEQTQYWNCEVFDVIEVEYNQCLYENKVLEELHKKWYLVLQLRELKGDLEAQENVFKAVYPDDDKKAYYSEKKRALSRKKKVKYNYDLGLDI